MSNPAPKDGRKRRRPRWRGVDVHLPMQGRDMKAGRYGQEAPNYPLPKETRIGERTEATNAEFLTWDTEAADAPKYFGRLSSRAIAVDASNHSHIVYGGDHLYYAYHDGTAWRYETVDSSSNVGWDASIALDTSGHAHISYVGENTLKYTTNTSSVV